MEETDKVGRYFVRGGSSNVCRDCRRDVGRGGRDTLTLTDVHSMPQSTEQAVKTQLKQNKSFSFIFHRF